jgi:hypothetical protein
LLSAEALKSLRHVGESLAARQEPRLRSVIVRSPRPGKLTDVEFALQEPEAVVLGERDDVTFKLSVRFHNGAPSRSFSPTTWAAASPILRSRATVNEDLEAATARHRERRSIEVMQPCALFARDLDAPRGVYSEAAACPTPKPCPFR